MEFEELFRKFIDNFCLQNLKYINSLQFMDSQLKLRIMVNIQHKMNNTYQITQEQLEKISNKEQLIDFNNFVSKSTEKCLALIGQIMKHGIIQQQQQFLNDIFIIQKEYFQIVDYLKPSGNFNKLLENIQQRLECVFKIYRNISQVCKMNKQQDLALVNETTQHTENEQEFHKLCRSQKSVLKQYKNLNVINETKYRNKQSTQAYSKSKQQIDLQTLSEQSSIFYEAIVDIQQELWKCQSKNEVPNLKQINKLEQLFDNYSINIRRFDNKQYGLTDNSEKYQDGNQQQYLQIINNEIQRKSKNTKSNHTIQLANITCKLDDNLEPLEKNDHNDSSSNKYVVQVNDTKKSKKDFLVLKCEKYLKKYQIDVNLDNKQGIVEYISKKIEDDSNKQTPIVIPGNIMLQIYTDDSY